jgi:predicted short-subunit dehydrogenase-like oxidoreductase (DUF2520 family)
MRAKLSTPDPSRAAGLADIVFITTPDRSVADVCRRVGASNAIHPGSVVIHTSGALSSEVLAPVRRAGAFALSLHPMQTFTDTAEALRNLPGSCIGLEGDAQALVWGRRIARDLGGKPLLIAREHKVLYHAAACIASNYLVVLLDISLQLLKTAGIRASDGLPAAVALVNGTVRNVGRAGTIRALTGPIERGDVETIQAHLRGLREALPECIDVYKALGRHTVGLAERKRSLSIEAAGRLRAMLR